MIYYKYEVVVSEWGICETVVASSHQEAATLALNNHCKLHGLEAEVAEEASVEVVVTASFGSICRRTMQRRLVPQKEAV